MEKMLLSLKNLYKVLMTNDFPIYSESVIGEKSRKGQTLLRFWQSQLADEFRSLPTGKMLWRNDGKRNRYVSNLCNRSLEQKLCSEYADELSRQITPAMLLNQIERFMTFLSARAYRHDVLLRRISEMLRLCSIDDNRVSEEIVQHLLKHTAECTENGPTSLFQAGYLLSVLTIYAASGDAMEFPGLSALRGETYDMNALWNLFGQKEARQMDTVSFLSLHAGILQDNPLPPHRFFGREEELYELREMAQSGRKCVISGMGGAGKTELLRQLLRLCSEERIADQIAVVPYERSIVESFLRAFPDYQWQEPEQGFQSILRMLERQAEEGFRILVLIDNMNNSLAEDPALEKLLLLPGSVLITSRRTELDGFETYRISDLSVSTGALIFRDNFGKPLSRADRDTLKQLLQNPAVCHPLTLRLMARASVSNGWSVPQLAEHLREGISDLSWTEEDRAVSLGRMYRGLYSKTMLPEEAREVAELFTLLPRDSYTREFLERYFPYLADGLQRKLDRLEGEGWLEKDEEGYSMHPLIVQCLRRKVITEERIGPVLRVLRRQLPESLFLSDGLQAEESKLCDILIACAQQITGPASRELQLDLMKAMGGLELSPLMTDKYVRLLERLLRDPEQDDLVELRYAALLGQWNRGTEEHLMAVYRKQKAQLTVPGNMFLDFCICAGKRLIGLNRLDLAERPLTEVLCEEAAVVQKANAYFYLIVRATMRNDYDSLLRLCEQGAAFTEEHPECGETITVSIWLRLANVYTHLGRKEPAEAAFRKVGGMIHDGTTALNKLLFLSAQADYEVNLGDPARALPYLEEQLKFIEEYWGKDPNYFSAVNTQALAYHRLGQLERAIELEQSVVEYARKAEKVVFTVSGAHNLSTFYLDFGKPEEAKALLEAVTAEVRQVGGAVNGAIMRILAQAHRQLGSPEEELTCLREAFPLLERGYGPEHPRTQDVGQRLRELEALYGKTADE